jgi:hypothetical protein
MTIFDVVEQCWLSRPQLTDSLVDQIVSEIEDSALIRAAEYLIANLTPRHGMPGPDVAKAISIMRWYQRSHEISLPQKWWLFHVVIENWHNLDVQARADLHL